VENQEGIVLLVFLLPLKKDIVVIIMSQFVMFMMKYIGQVFFRILTIAAKQINLAGINNSKRSILMMARFK
jgi:hypothetical protein